MSLTDDLYGAAETAFDYNPVTVARRSDVVQNEIERGKQDWAETKADPVGEFKENLLFGATGPAPSLDENFNYSWGGGDPHLETVNKTAWETGTGTEPPERPGDNAPDTPPWLKKYLRLALALLGLYAVGQLLTVHANVGGGS